MAERPEGYGFTAELEAKMSGKYDPELEKDVREWMGAVTGEPLDGEGPDQLHSVLRDGTYLCNLVNKIQPGSVKKMNTSKMAFKQMENINFFLSACEALGCAKMDLFQTVDLYEAQNMGAVITGILALGRRAQTIGFDGPVLGPKEASENKREFSEEQMRAGGNVIGLQMGSNQGASQAGQNFGKTRAIID
ncbi:myophilin-like [Symsagittifera roscoffensis]|uniref:myophilin-like n=1 Tax=Symsagittifera roscoffensis TaxID=84072 RepID=UPI00307C24E3